MLGKSVTAFGKNWLRFFGKTCFVFGTNWLRCLKTRLRVWELVRFGEIGSDFSSLGQSSSLTVLNAKQVWVLEVLRLGVSKKKSTGGKLEGYNAQTYKL